ncbi:MAG: hypothetical protein EB131_07720 [Betaproteobacteria bacterium]|nr:hypothetical protein [Betaproteobacteria bacterium]
MLAQIGLEPQVLRLSPLRAVDESVVAGEPPLVYVKRLARAKALAGVDELEALGLPAAPVLGADTTVALAARIFGKPQDAAEALAMLAELSGRVHQVLTAVALAAHGAVDLRTARNGDRRSTCGSRPIWASSSRRRGLAEAR